MPTKLSRICEAIMEAAWLVALIVAPVFFNIYSNRIFEPDKITLIRSLALLILAAWTVKLIEEGWRPPDFQKAGTSFIIRLRQTPFLIPVLALAAIYLLSTLFSVTLRVSMWGSYQRLQGLYTTYSYLVIFASIAANLRRRAQVQRLITVAILASLPVSLYGVIQRYQLDPIPWGGDVSTRIASNMGNSIFVAAYLVMVIPLTVVRIIETIEDLIGSRDIPWNAFICLVVYFPFLIGLQITALYFTGSRGPWLGWAASLVILWLGFSLIWRVRWLTYTGVGLAVVAASFLIVFNIPGGPLEDLRSKPGLGRLGQLLNAESRTGRVRTLIWEGAANLVFPHAPIVYPNGVKDAFNILRPVIGYGPESMYVAYNPFYPPELTQVEKRNASPDRSHNETWDALVTTGLIGLVVYLTLFSSVIFYSLKWLGLVQKHNERNLFLALFFSGGLISSLGFVVWRGISYLGVALPFGMIVGAIIYLIWRALFGRKLDPIAGFEKAQAYIILGLLAAVVAHFVEINFGIAIVSTRTYFWTYAALLLSAGYYLPKSGEFLSTGAGPDTNKSAGNPPMGSDGERKLKSSPNRGRNRKLPQRSNRKRFRSSKITNRKSWLDLPHWVSFSIAAGAITAIVLSTLGFLYITNSSRSDTIVGTIWYSLTRLKQTPDSLPAVGILSLIVTTFLTGNLLMASEWIEDEADTKNPLIPGVGKIFLTGLAVSVLLTVLYWSIHSGRLIDLVQTTANSIEQVLDLVKKSESLLSGYYGIQFLILLLFSVALVPSWPERNARLGWISLLIGMGAFLSAVFLASITNLRIVQADMAFKTAELFARQDTWPVAIRIYEHANELAPNEDYYYLFLGRAYLEYARTLDNPDDRDRLISRAAQDLLKAQSNNPLNPDHTANLARLHSLWALTSTNQATLMQRAKLSDEYFSNAVVLKPKDAKLWDEWALLDINIYQQEEAALTKLNTALEIDPYYDWTYGLLGEHTLRFEVEKAEPQTEPWRQAHLKAAGYLTKALELAGAENSSFAYQYAVSLAGIHDRLNMVKDAIDKYELALSILPENSDNWKVEEALARLYIKAGNPSQALVYAQAALESAPDDQKSRLQELVSDLGG